MPLVWEIPETNLPYNTEYIDVGDSVTFNWMGLHGVYQLTSGAQSCHILLTGLAAHLALVSDFT